MVADWLRRRRREMSQICGRRRNLRRPAKTRNTTTGGNGAAAKPPTAADHMWRWTVRVQYLPATLSRGNSAEWRRRRRKLWRATSKSAAADCSQFHLDDRPTRQAQNSCTFAATRLANWPLIEMSTARTIGAPKVGRTSESRRRTNSCAGGQQL